MHRFFCDKKLDSNYFELSDELLKHSKVLRIGSEEFLVNYQNEFYKCKLENNLAKIISKQEINNELDYKIYLAIGLIKFERFEWLIEKATELGVFEIVPFYSQFTQKHKLLNQFQNKKNRFEKIIKFAAEQSFRNIIPNLKDPISFEDLLNFYVNQKLVAHEISDNQNFDLNLLTKNDLLLTIGSEGGFSSDEIAKFKEANFKVIHLGKTILRSETAAISLISKVK